MKQSNLMKATFTGIFILIFSSLSYSGFAAAASQNSNGAMIIETQNTDWLSNCKRFIKRNARAFKKISTKKARQFKKEYREKSTLKKVGWGIGIVILGALVTLGSILTLSGWWFIIGLGLIIFGALKVVVNILGIAVQ
jgi:sterol desaturase/sphingolipid hydroxylase (fatty acid hydroxylase superfamily)